MKKQFFFPICMLLFFLGLTFGCKKGNSEDNTENPTPIAENAPKAPSDLVAKIVSRKRINLVWKDNSNDETIFQLERALQGSSTFTEIAPLSANQTFYQDTGLDPDKSYSYRIRAKRNTFFSTYSNTATAKTFADLGPSITAPVTSDGKFSINTAYTFCSGVGTSEDSYRIEESTSSPTSGFQQIDRSPNAPAQYSFALNRPNGTYYYRVRTFDCEGLTKYSAVVKVVVTVPVPKGKLRIFNNSSFDLITIRINNQNLNRVVPPQGTYDLEFPGGTSVFYYVANGFGGQEMFVEDGSLVIRAGQEHKVTLRNPTIGELLAGFQPSLNWKGSYWDRNNVLHYAGFVFKSTGAFDYYDGSRKIASGQATLKSWPKYSKIVTFRLSGWNEDLYIDFPYAKFFVKHGPPSWPIIEYVRQ